MGNTAVMTPPVSFVKELVILGQIGHEGPLGTMRYIVDKGTHTVWYVGDEGEIMQNVMDRGQYDIWTETGALAVYPSSADIWDETHEWDQMVVLWDETDITGGPDLDAYWYKWSVLMAIPFYLLKKGEDGPKGDQIRKMYQNYKKGLCTFVELIDIIATIHGFGA